MSDIATLTWWASFWDTTSVVSAGFVLFGVVGESVADFNILAELVGLKKRSVLRERIAKAGLLILIAALAVEVAAAIGSHNASEQIISTLNTELDKTIQRGSELAIAEEKIRSLLNDEQKRLAEISNKEEELEKLQSSFLDELTPRQLEYGEFANDLAGITPVQIIIEAEADPDSQVFGPDLDAAFRQANWTQRSLLENRHFSFIPGIWVKYLHPPTGPLTNDTARKAAQAICRALNAQLLTKARVMPAMTLEMLHDWQKGVPDKIWALQHANGPSALDWPDSIPSGAVVIHIGQNRSNLFLNRTQAKKGLPPLPDAPVNPLYGPCDERLTR